MVIIGLTAQENESPMKSTEVRTRPEFTFLAKAVCICSIYTAVLVTGSSAPPAKAEHTVVNGCGDEFKGLDSGLGGYVPNRPFGWNFKPACDAHDRCYGKIGKGKIACDRAFREDLLKQCPSFGGIKSPGCVSLAILYWKAVEEGSTAGEAYQKSRKHAIQEARAEDASCFSRGSQKCKLSSYTAMEWGRENSFSKSCKTGHYISGFRQNVEPYQGKDKDDTALNGIQFKCSTIDHSQTYELDPIASSPLWGKWSEWQMCSPGKFITSYALKVELHQGDGDDTGTNGFLARCSSPQESPSRSTQILQATNNGSWGYLQNIPGSGEYVSAGKGYLLNTAHASIEPYQGRGIGKHDDTAMNDIWFDAIKALRVNSSSPTFSPNNDANTQRNEASLNGTWQCNDGGSYIIRQSGASISWAGSGGNFRNTFNGQITGNTISGYWQDTASSTTQNSGQLTLRIENKNRLVRIGHTGAFTGSTWEKIQR